MVIWGFDFECGSAG